MYTERQKFNNFGKSLKRFSKISDFSWPDLLPESALALFVMSCIFVIYLVLSIDRKECLLYIYFIRHLHVFLTLLPREKNATEKNLPRIFDTDYVSSRYQGAE